jgi:hypothetical protein
VTGSKAIGVGTTTSESGAWVAVATIDFAAPGGASSLTINLVVNTGGGSGTVVPASGVNVGAAIHTGSAPGSPQQSRAGDGAVTFTTPVGNKLTLYIKGAHNTFGADYIEVAANQDITSSLRTGFVT